MDKQKRLDRLYLDLARRISKESVAERSKVGSLLVKDDNILSFGWNGTPTGAPNACEFIDVDGNLRTRTDVLHSEANAILKLVANGGRGTEGATLYCTLSPCVECTKLILQAKIKRVVYDEEYRITEGIDILREYGVIVEQLKGD